MDQRIPQRNEVLNVQIETDLTKKIDFDDLGEEGFIIRNSWGENWNGDGYTLYKYTDWGKHWEIWCTIDKDFIPIPEEESEEEEGEKDKGNDEEQDDIDDTHQPQNETYCEKLFRVLFA